MKPTTVAAQASSNSDELHSTKISNTEVKTVQAGEVAASVNVVGNVLAEKTSSNCSNVDFACPESKDIAGTKKSTDLNVSVEKYNFEQVAHPLVGAPPVGHAVKKLIILDVNGLLADIVPVSQCAHKADIVISRKSVFKRPFCDDFLQFCFEKFNVGVWSSRVKKNVDQVINFLMADSRHKLLFCWDQFHCTDTGFTTVENSSKPLVLKELKKLWDKLEPGLPWNKGDYNESNTLLLDDSPYKALRNPENTAIFPYSYSYKDAGDSSLGPGGDLRVYLEKLVEAQNVQEFVAHNPFGQQAITESNSKWGFYQRILIDESREKIASSSAPYTENLGFPLDNMQYGPQPTSFVQESPAAKMQYFSGDNARSRDNSESYQIHPYLQQRQLPHDLHHSAHSSVYGVPGKISVSSRYPEDVHHRNQPLYPPDYGATRSSSHFNPYASTFEKPLRSRFSSTVFKPEKDLSYSNKHGYPSSSSHVSVDERGNGSRQGISSQFSTSEVGRVLPRPGDDQYDPLLDSIEPSSSYKKTDYVQKLEPPDSSNIVPKLEESNLPLDVEENNKKDFGGIALATSPDNEEIGETADAEVCDVEKGSQSNPDVLEKTDTGEMEMEMEIDQMKSPDKGKKSQESRSMKLFKVYLADFVKEVLKPSWRRGQMSKEAYKTVVKKTVDKVSGAMKSHQVPKSKEKMHRYIDSSRRKLTKLVMGYVDKYAKG